MLGGEGLRRWRDNRALARGTCLWDWFDGDGFCCFCGCVAASDSQS
jgi:hypothetical protein